MHRLCWITDIHLNHMAAGTADQLIDLVRADQPDGIWLTGDIAESDSLVQWLQKLDQQLQLPIYFVLGNHDYYHGSIRQLRREISDLCASHPRLNYLSSSDWIEITPGSGLLGHDGWADGRIGDYGRSQVMLNDYRLISELAPYGHVERQPILERLADEAAEHISSQLNLALAACDNVYLLTHVPPLRAACWYEGDVADDEWAPHFTCQAIGQVLMETMQLHPDKQLTVLCGHTHHSGSCQPIPNLTILTGSADYDRAEIAGTFILD
jgi:predicted MPP superfamily phosphohydrolase